MNSKAKGCQYERDISKTLSLWLTDGEREDVLWRSAGSGNRSTIADDHRAHAGDLMATTPEGFVLTEPTYIEIKRYKDLEIKKIVKGTGKLFKVWNDTVEEAKKFEKWPVLIARQNYYPALWCVPGRIFKPLVEPVPVLEAPRADCPMSAYLLDDILEEDVDFLQNDFFRSVDLSLLKGRT